MVDIVVVFFIVHHLLQVVVVGHMYWYVVREGLAQIGLGIISQIVLILIEVERIRERRVFHTIDMALGITLRIEELPTTTGNLVSTRCDVRLGDAEHRTRQDDVWRLDVLHGGHTTLEVQVDVQNVALAHRRDVCTRHITLYIVVLIDHGDDLLCREVEDVGAAGHKERARLRRCQTVDREVLLFVGESAISSCINNDTLWHCLTLAIGAACATCHTSSVAIYCMALIVILNSVGLTTIIIGTGSGEVQLSHLLLICITQTTVGIAGNNLSGSIRSITKDDGLLHDIVVTGFTRCHSDGSPIVLFVRQTLILGAG